ncbi:hypothetical protein DFJ74DRAFT_109771, partial [Hyaloraphidium curvatum]
MGPPRAPAALLRPAGTLPQAAHLVWSSVAARPRPCDSVGLQARDEFARGPKKDDAPRLPARWLRPLPGLEGVRGHRRQAPPRVRAPPPDDQAVDPAPRDPPDPPGFRGPYTAHGREASRTAPGRWRRSGQGHAVAGAFVPFHPDGDAGRCGGLRMDARAGEGKGSGSLTGFAFYCTYIALFQVALLALLLPPSGVAAPAAGAACFPCESAAVGRVASAPCSPISLSTPGSPPTNAMTKSTIVEMTASIFAVCAAEMKAMRYPPNPLAGHALMSTIIPMFSPNPASSAATGARFPLVDAPASRRRNDSASARKKAPAKMAMSSGYRYASRAPRPRRPQASRLAARVEGVRRKGREGTPGKDGRPRPASGMGRVEPSRMRVKVVTVAYRP